MLKIKDNVDLNIFKNNYNAKFKYDEYTGKLTKIELRTRGTQKFIFFKKNKKILWFKKLDKGFIMDDWDDYLGYVCFRNDMVDLLYDLIKADLVEKVEE